MSISLLIPVPGRLFAPGCAVAAGLLTVSLAPRVVVAAPAASSMRVVLPGAGTSSTRLTLRAGDTQTFALPPRATYKVEEGAMNVLCRAENGVLRVQGLMVGTARIRVQVPNQRPRVLAFQVEGRAGGALNPLAVDLGEGFGAKPFSPGTVAALPAAPLQAPPPLTLIRRGNRQVVEAPRPSGGLLPPAATLVSPTPLELPVPAVGGNTSDAVDTANINSQRTTPAATVAATGGGTALLPIPPSPTRTIPLPLNVRPRSVTPRPTRVPPRVPPRVPSVVQRVSNPQASSTNTAQISPNFPPPARGLRPNVRYNTTSRLPGNLGGANTGRAVQVRAGLARLISFPDNILSVFFSDPSVMDARAINARTIAVTGVGTGQSTLAVFTARNPGDVVGKANIYRIQTQPRSGGAAPPAIRDPRTLEAAIRTALNDPRVRVSVSQLPDGTLAARLVGALRNPAEVEGAVTTAQFFVPRVVPSLYADINAPSIDAVLNPAIPGALDPTLQVNLRRITGNNSIELIPLPSGLGVKAEVNSTGEAEAILRVLPSLNQPVVPFIVVRGAASEEGPYYNSNIPNLQGEDLQLTQKLQSVTGVRSVYAVRASGNSVAIYGTVRSRGEYETVRRYGFIIAQASAPVALQGTTQGGSVFRPQGGEPPPLSSYDPVGGYARQLGVQMFVRITDPAQATIRNVTIETNIVEITKTALKNLGVEYGSATLLSEDITPATATSGPITNRTVDPSFRPGAIVAGNGLVGSGGFGVIDPIRARLSALSQRNDVRILSRPSVRSTEGMAAQITIGGERPVPSAVATQGAVGSQVEFRRYGVIITMRPTLTDDNTILLQIRADVTQPDRTFEINLNGALIPGEIVRSIDTTITVRPGDVVVMGGLLTNEKRQQTSKVPILGDLPLLGSLFRSRRFENNETELAIFMTPRIDSIPTTPEGMEIFRSAPGFPALPSRQDSNEILFQNSRSGGN